MASHGLHRTFTAFRCVAGDGPAYTPAQIAHAAFTLGVYTHAVKRRERLSGAELQGEICGGRLNRPSDE